MITPTPIGRAMRPSIELWASKMLPASGCDDEEAEPAAYRPRSPLVNLDAGPGVADRSRVELVLGLGSLGDGAPLENGVGKVILSNIYLISRYVETRNSAELAGGRSLTTDLL